MSLRNKAIKERPDKQIPKHRPSFHKGQNKKKIREALTIQQRKLSTARMQKGNFDERCAKESEYFWTCVRENTKMQSNFSLQMKTSTSKSNFMISLKFDLRKPIDLMYNHDNLDLIDIKGQGLKLYTDALINIHGIENEKEEEEVETADGSMINKDVKIINKENSFEYYQALCLIPCFKIKAINGAPMFSHDNITNYIQTCIEKRNEQFIFIQLIEKHITCYHGNKTLLSLFPDSNIKLLNFLKNSKHLDNTINGAVKKINNVNNNNNNYGKSSSIDRDIMIKEKLSVQIVDAGNAIPSSSSASSSNNNKLNNKFKSPIANQPLKDFNDLIKMINTFEKENKEKDNINKYKDITSLSTSFKHQIPLSKLFNNVLNKQRLGFQKPTEVQAHCIPLALLELDILACAETGSGKVNMSRV